MRLAGFFLKELHYETASFYTTIYLSYSIYIALSTSVIDNMSYETDIFAPFSTNLLLCFTPESFTLSAMFLAFIMYTISPEVTERNGDNLYLTSFFVFVGLFRYLQIIFVEERSGNPTLIFLKDNFIRIIIILWIISFFVITKFFR